MGALRKAGVWLGLVEDEDEDGRYETDDAEETYDSSARYETASRYEGSARHDGASRYETAGRYDGAARYDAHRSDTHRSDTHRPRHESEREFDDAEFADDFDTPAEPARGSHLSEPEPEAPVRSATPVRESASVRPLNRASVTSLTQDNLALAPQVQLRERAVVADDSQNGYRITTVHPTTYSEARTIGEHFRDSTPVIMNLSEMDEADAMRLVDFAAGLIFGLRGSIERVTNRVFLLSPANVMVTAEDKAKIAEGGFFNQS